MIGKARFDIIVIGSGPGGQKAAIQGAKAGKKVAIVDREPNIGGACVYRGTIPSKTLRESALTMVSLKRSAGVVDYAIREELEVSSLMARLDKVLGGSSTFSVVLAQYPLLRRRNLSTYFERYYRNV